MNIKPSTPRTTALGTGSHRIQTRKQVEEAKANLGKLEESVGILNTSDKSPRTITKITEKKKEFLTKIADGPMADYGGKSLADKDVRKKLRSEVRQTEAERLNKGEDLTDIQKKILNELNKLDAHTNLSTLHPLDVIKAKYKKEDIDVVNEFRRPGKLSKQLEKDIAASRDALSQLEKL